MIDRIDVVLEFCCDSPVTVARKFQSRPSILSSSAILAWSLYRLPLPLNAVSGYLSQFISPAITGMDPVSAGDLSRRLATFKFSHY